MPRCVGNRMTLVVAIIPGDIWTEIPDSICQHVAVGSVTQTGQNEKQIHPSARQPQWTAGERSPEHVFDRDLA